MKGFFIFYSAVVLLVFCLMSSTLSNGNSIFIFNSTTTCKVTVSGAVDYPATYEVDSNTYVFEVLTMANLAYNADLASINLYEFVSNNSKISVPYGIININTAGLLELQELSGVGPSNAQKIIDYRVVKQFTKIEDLINISQSIYDNNAHRITV